MRAIVTQMHYNIITRLALCTSELAFPFPSALNPTWKSITLLLLVVNLNILQFFSTDSVFPLGHSCPESKSA